MTLEEKKYYALGAAIASNYANLGLKIDTQAFAKGFSAVINHETLAIPPTEIQSILENLQKEIDDTLKTLGFKEDRKFVPHLTVSRIKSSLNKKSLLNLLDAHREHEFGSEIITKISFKKSTLTPHGPIYETLKEFKLKSV